MQTMKKYRNQAIGGFFLIFGIYLALLLLLDSRERFSVEGVLAAIRTFPLWLILPLILTQVLVTAFRFIEWHYYLGVIEARDKLSFWDSLLIFVVIQTMVVSPGKAAELLKSVLLKAKTGIPIARSAPIVLAERIVDGTAVIILLTVALFFASDTLGLGVYNGIDYALFARTIIFTSAALIIGGLIAVQVRPLAELFFRILGFIPLLRRMERPLREFYESSREVFALRHFLPMVCVGVGVYLTSVAGFTIVLYGLGLTVTSQLLLQAMFIVGIASALGALSAVPNGAGVTEISTTGLLLALVAPQQPIVTVSLATAAALIQGFFHRWLRVLVGLTAGIIWRDRIFNEELQRVFEEIEQREGEAEQHQAEEVIQGMPAS